MNNYVKNSLSVLLVFALTGCGLLTQKAESPIIIPTPTPVVLATEIPMPTEIPLPTPMPPTATPMPTATPIQTRMLSAQVVFDNYILRIGPGRLFDRVNMYNSGEMVTVIGREMSNNWVLVQTGDHYSGWMNVVGLKVQGEITSLPVFRVDHVQSLQGHVYLPGRIAATGIVVAMSPSEGDPSAAPLESTTNQDGLWVIYFPESTEGSWLIGPNAFVCEESNAVTPNSEGCTLNGNLPKSQIITLPYAEELVIEFEILAVNP